MKAALYARVSTDRQGTGLESQVRALEDHCRQRGIVDYAVFSDEGISGTKSSRPGLDALLAAVRAGEVKAVVVYSFSRFARSTRHLLEALDEFQRLGVAFVSLSESLDTSTPTGRAVFVILAAVAQLERDLIAERVRNGLANARAKGKRLGRARTRNGPLIRELAARGLTYREISRLAKCSHGAIAEELREARSESALPTLAEHLSKVG